MTAQFGIREITRNFSILDNYDYVEIEDKKTHSLKGIFVSSVFAKEVKEFMDDKLKKQKQKNIDNMMAFAGISSGEFKELSSQEIKTNKKEKFYE